MRPTKERGGVNKFDVVKLRNVGFRIFRLSIDRDFQGTVIEDLKPKPANTFLDVLQKLAIGVVGFLLGKGL